MLNALKPIDRQTLKDLVSPSEKFTRMIASNLNGVCEEFCRAKNITHEDFKSNGLLTRRDDSKDPCKVIWELRYKNRIFFRAESTPLAFAGEKLLGEWV
jgi:hypothetical protein